jgi:hypothetical protein
MRERRTLSPLTPPGGGLLMRARRWAVSALAAAMAALLNPGVAMAATYTDEIRGIEYSATSTVGEFAGGSKGDLGGLWQATVEHEPLGPGEVEITGGTFAIYDDRKIAGTFVDGSIIPKHRPAGCEKELFDVHGELELDGGGTGSFVVVLTHFRAKVGSSCATVGATVAGTVTLELPRAAVG